MNQTLSVNSMNSKKIEIYSQFYTIHVFLKAHIRSVLFHMTLRFPLSSFHYFSHFQTFFPIMNHQNKGTTSIGQLNAQPSHNILQPNPVAQSSTGHSSGSQGSMIGSGLDPFNVHQPQQQMKQGSSMISMQTQNFQGTAWIFI